MYIRTNMVVSSFSKKPKLKTLERRQSQCKDYLSLGDSREEEMPKGKPARDEEDFFGFVWVLVVVVGFEGEECRWLGEQDRRPRSLTVIRRQLPRREAAWVRGEELSRMTITG